MAVILSDLTTCTIYIFDNHSGLTSDTLSRMSILYRTCGKNMVDAELEIYFSTKKKFYICYWFSRRASDAWKNQLDVLFCTVCSHAESKHLC